MDRFVKEKFEKFFNEKWNFNVGIFEIEDKKYKYDFVQKIFEIFEAGYKSAKEEIK